MRHSCPAASATAPPPPGALVVRLACLSQQAPQFFQASKLLEKSPKSTLFTVVLTSTLFVTRNSGKWQTRSKQAMGIRYCASTLA